MIKTLSQILAIRNSNIQLYERYLRYYENAFWVNWRLIFEFSKKYKGWKNYDFIRKYDFTRNIYSTYNWFLSKLKIEQPIISSYDSSMAKTKLDKLRIYSAYAIANNKDVINQLRSEWTLCGVSYAQVYQKHIKDYETTQLSNWKKIRVLKNDFIEPTLIFTGVFDTITDISWNNRYIGSIKRFTNKQITELYPEFISKNIPEAPKYSILENFNRVKKVDIMSIACEDMWPKSRLYDVYTQNAVEWIHEVIDWYEYWDDWFLKQKIIIDWEEIYEGDSLNPYEEFPIVPFYYSKIPWSNTAEWIWTWTIEAQSEIDHLYIWYKLWLKTFVYPDWSTRTWTENDAVIHEWLTVKRRTWWDNWWVEMIKYYDPNLLTMVRNEILTIEQKAINNFLINNINNWWSTIRVSGEVNERRQSRENKVSEVIDNMWITASEILKQFIKIKKFNLWMIDIWWKEINPLDLDLWFNITFDWEDLLKLKESMISDLINKIWILQPFNVDTNTWEPIVSWIDVFNMVGDYAGIKWLIASPEEKLRRIDEWVKYNAEKSKKMPQAPSTRLDKVSATISIPIDKLSPEYQAAMLNVVEPWIAQQVAPQQTQQAAPSQDIPQLDQQQSAPISTQDQAILDYQNNNVSPL